MIRVIVVDNHDSFVHTLCGYLEQLGAAVTMVEADEVADADALAADADAILISPGPGAPAAAGASIDIVHAAARTRTPLLGVCLGHQALAEAFGATVGHAPELMHGMVSDVVHDGAALYRDIPERVTVGRYHSLAIDPVTLPDDLVVTGRTEEGVIMSIAHRVLPLTGVQFHPESVLTDHGYRLLANWLEDAGCRGAVARSPALSALESSPS